MAIEHFKEYYNNTAKAYMEVNLLLNKLLEGVQDGTIDMERAEMFKDNIKPIVDNFSQVSYFKFLLDIPNKKSKRAKHQNMNKKLLSKLDPSLSPQELIKANEETLQKLRDLME